MDLVDLLISGRKLEIFHKGSVFREFYLGHMDFEGANGGTWKKYINIPIDPPSVDYNQIIMIDDTYVTALGSNGKIQSSIASEFWSNIRDNFKDIRFFNEKFEELYYLTLYESFDSKLAVYIVRVPAYTKEVNIGFGNPLALESSKKEFSSDPYVMDANDGGEGYPPLVDSNGEIIFEGHAAWGGSTWATDRNRLDLYVEDGVFFDLSNFVFEFKFIYDQFDYTTGTLDRRNTLILVKDSNGDNIFEIYRSGYDGKLYEYDGTWGYQDVRDYSHLLGSITNGVEYTIKMTYDGVEWKIYLNDEYKVTVDRSSAKNNPPGILLFNPTMQTDGSGAEGDIKWRWILSPFYETVTDLGTPTIRDL